MGAKQLRNSTFFLNTKGNVMKICIKCQVNKQEDEFAIKNSNKNIRSIYCKECHKIYAKEHYKKNKFKYIQKAYQWRKKIKELINNFKNIPCKDCNQKYPHYVMDFDHLKDKTFNISERLGMVSIKKLLNEIKKCEVVCANCHRIRTWKRLHKEK